MQMQICSGTLKGGYGGEEKNEMNLSSIIKKVYWKQRVNVPQKNMCKEAALNKLIELLKVFQDKSKSWFELLETSLGSLLSHDRQTQVKF